MSFAPVGSLGASGQGAGASFVLTLAAACEVGNLAVVTVCKENVGIVNDSNTNEIAGVTDSAGNTWTKAYEYTRTAGVAADGTVVAVFFCRVTTTIPAGGTLTAAFSASVAGSSIVAREFTVGADVSLVGTPQVSTSTGVTDPGSLTLAGLASAEHLFLRGIGSDISATLTPTVGFTSISTVPGTGQRVLGEFKIATGTGDTSAPTLGVSFNNDTASIFVALVESGAPAVVPSQGLLMGMM